MAFVHWWNSLTSSEASDADSGVGSVLKRESADVSGLQAGWWGSLGEARIPEDITGGGELRCDGQRRGGRKGGCAVRRRASVCGRG